MLDFSDGSPIVGAWVFPRDGEALLSFSSASTTDAKGSFRLRANTRAAAELVCRAPGYLQASVPPVAGSNGLVTIQLARGAAIHGRVLDDLGAPISGARVWAFTDGNSVAWPHGERWWLTTNEGQGGTTTSDANGAFEISGLDPERRYRVKAARSAYTSIADDDMIATPGTSREVALQLSAVAELSVAVIDEETRAPVRHAVLRIATPRGTAMRNPTHYAALSGEVGALVKGIAAFRFIRFDPAQLPVTLTTRVTASAHGYRSQAVELPVSLGGRVEHVLPLARDPGVVFGQVRVRAEWQGGAPFNGQLTVLFANPMTHGGQGIELLMQDGASGEEFSMPVGTYSTATVGAGPMGVWWDNRGEIGSCEVFESANQQPSICRVSLRGAVLRVRVRSADGAPQPGYGLAVVTADGRGGLHPYWSQEYDASRVASAPADYADVIVPPGRLACYAKMPDGRQGRTDVIAGEMGDVVETVVVLR